MKLFFFQKAVLKMLMRQFQEIDSNGKRERYNDI